MEELSGRHYNKVNKREGKLNKPRKDLDMDRRDFHLVVRDSKVKNEAFNKLLVKGTSDIKEYGYSLPYARYGYRQQLTALCGEIVHLLVLFNGNNDSARNIATLYADRVHNDLNLIKGYRSEEATIKAYNKMIKMARLYV